MSGLFCTGLQTPSHQTAKAGVGTGQVAIGPPRIDVPHRLAKAVEQELIQESGFR
jgi:hypothetical protein